MAQCGILVMLALMICGCAGEPREIAQAGEEAVAVEGRGSIVGRVAGLAGGDVAAVFLDPHGPVEAMSPSEVAVMDQFGRDFIPHLLVVQEGQIVQFRNSEDELHNVHVIDSTGTTLINVAMPILGGTYHHAFEQVGDYNITCNVHQEMAARILVTSSPFFVVSDRDGRFSVSGIPRGAYTLTVRNRGKQLQRVVEISGGETEMNVDLAEASASRSDTALDAGALPGSRSSNLLSGR